MKLALSFLVLLLAGLAVAPGASARVIEMGANAPTARPDCPEPEECQAVGRVTGYQGRSGTLRNPFVVPRAGTIVAFTLALGRPTDRQRRFFTEVYGGPPRVRLSVLRKGKRRRTRLDHRLIAQSRPFEVEPYFGSRPTFALDRPLRVARGHIVALTVPTWAPVFSPRLSGANWWRSSRRRGDCDNVAQRAAQERVRGVVVYGCTYRTARLTYTASYVPDPRPVRGNPRRR